MKTRDLRRDLLLLLATSARPVAGNGCPSRSNSAYLGMRCVLETAFIKNYRQGPLQATASLVHCVDCKTSDCKLLPCFPCCGTGSDACSVVGQVIVQTQSR